MPPTFLVRFGPWIAYFSWMGQLPKEGEAWQNDVTHLVAHVAARVDTPLEHWHPYLPEICSCYQPQLFHNINHKSCPLHSLVCTQRILIVA